MGLHLFFEKIGEAVSRQGGMDKDIAVIGDKDRIDWHLDGSTLSLKVPEMEGLRTWSLISQTCMAGHIVRSERRGVVLQVRGRCNKGGSVVSTDGPQASSSLPRSR